MIRSEQVQVGKTYLLYQTSPECRARLQSLQLQHSYQTPGTHTRKQWLHIHLLNRKPCKDYDQQSLTNMALILKQAFDFAFKLLIIYYTGSVKMIELQTILCSCIQNCNSTMQQGFLNGSQTFGFVVYMQADVACNQANYTVIVWVMGCIKPKPSSFKLNILF